jgi:nucleoside-diphosphate-sugar epimerase
VRILLTGAGGNIGTGIAGLLRDSGHDVVLSDIGPLPDLEQFAGSEFHQVDIQAGFGLEKAIDGCDLLLHTPAWHGIHSRVKSEVDFWRLNVDGAFWAMQAARAAGVSRLVFLSSMSWFGHYEKYGFTKRVGEELCEYHRQQNGMRYVIIRPHDFTPWNDNWLNRYGARLLYGGVDREDVLDCVRLAVDALAGPPRADEPEGHIVHAVRPNAFGDGDLTGWEDDPGAACERIFPGSREILAPYSIDISRRPSVVEPVGAELIGYKPTRHFGTFLAELANLGPEQVAALHCPY